MNWGKGITLFLVAFIVFITTLAVILMRTDSELVSEDYYKREVEYGNEIEAEQNALDIKAVLNTDINESGVFIQIKNTGEIDELLVYLLRNNNPDLDIQKIVKGPSVFIDKTELVAGKYGLTASWKSDDKYFQMKKEIWIP